MKKYISALLALLLLFTMAACSNNPKETGGNDTDERNTYYTGYDYENTDLSPFVILGDYTGLSVELKKVQITDELFETEVTALLESYAYYEPVTDRKVEEGDVIVVDYTGYKDGVAFTGGSAQNVEMEAKGNTGFIEGFAEAFIGQMPGEEFSFNIVFPQEYHNANLAGAEVTFVGLVHSIHGDERIVPELTDAFVNEKFGYNTVEEFNILYREKLEKQAAYNSQNTMYAELWATVFENAQILAYPEGEVDQVYNDTRSAYESYASTAGMTYEDFLAEYVGMTDQQLRAAAENYVAEDLVLYCLQDALGAELTDQEYDDGCTYYAEMYEMTKIEFLSYYGEYEVRTTLVWEDTMKALADISNITEVE